MKSEGKKPLYTAPRPINEAKLKDLKQLMCYIPPVHHPFYDGLSVDDAENEDD